MDRKRVAPEVLEGQLRLGALVDVFGPAQCTARSVKSSKENGRRSSMAMGTAGAESSQENVGWTPLAVVLQPINMLGGGEAHGKITRNSGSGLSDHSDEPFIS